MAVLLGLELVLLLVMEWELLLALELAVGWESSLA